MDPKSKQLSKHSISKFKERGAEGECRSFINHEWMIGMTYGDPSQRSVAWAWPLADAIESLSLTVVTERRLRALVPMQAPRDRPCVVGTRLRLLWSGEASEKLPTKSDRANNLHQQSARRRSSRILHQLQPAELLSSLRASRRAKGPWRRRSKHSILPRCALCLTLVLTLHRLNGNDAALLQPTPRGRRIPLSSLVRSSVDRSTLSHTQSRLAGSLIMTTITTTTDIITRIITTTTQRRTADTAAPHLQREKNAQSSRSPQLRWCCRCCNGPPTRLRPTPPC